MYLYRNGLKNLNAHEVMIATTGENARVQQEEQTVAVPWGEPKQQSHAPELEITGKILRKQFIRTPAGQYESAHENSFIGHLELQKQKSRTAVFDVATMKTGTEK